MCFGMKKRRGLYSSGGENMNGMPFNGGFFWILAYVFRGLGFLDLGSCFQRTKGFLGFGSCFRGPKVLDPGSCFQRPRIFGS